MDGKKNSGAQQEFKGIARKQSEPGIEKYFLGCSRVRVVTSSSPAAAAATSETVPAVSSSSAESQQHQEEFASVEQTVQVVESHYAEEGASCESVPESLCSTPVAASSSYEVTDLGAIKDGPAQVQLLLYPYDTFGKQNRSFQASWFSRFFWLEYSVTMNAAFCFPCRHFLSKHSRLNIDSLCTTGYKNWKRAIDSFGEHETTAAHKSSVLAWKMSKETVKSGDVVEQMQTGTDLQIRERRDYLLRIVAISKLLGKQGISFRGHDESEDSDNKGHFLELLNLLSNFDPFLQNHTPPENATYTSPVSQNEMLQCCSEEVTAKIIAEMKASGMYAIMADEASDHHKEQLAICVRYVLPDSGDIKERFLGFRELKQFNADAITESLQKCLKDHGLDRLLCVAQTYDGAAVMSGVSGGVQAKFQKYHPEAIYVHCYAHELNLVLCHTCKAIKDAKDFFNTMENLYTFFSTSLIHHHHFKEIQNTLGVQQGELVQLSDTRWACQIRSVNALITNFTAVNQCLSETQSSTAAGLLMKLKKLSTIFCLCMFQSLLTTTEGFHTLLQKEDLDLAKAADLKEAVSITLKSMRTTEKASEILQKAQSLLSHTNTEGEETVVARRKRQRHMEDFVCEQSPCSREDVSTEDDFRTKLFFPCLDRMISELEHRFSSVKEEIMRGIQACSPLSSNFLSDDLRQIANHYKLEYKAEEALVAKNYFARRSGRDQTKSMIQVYKLLDGAMFPTVKEIVQIALTVPVSSCSCERSFSSLRRLHSWLRCTMGQTRLQNLAILAIEKNLLQSVSDEDIIDRFACMHARRQPLA